LSHAEIAALREAGVVKADQSTRATDQRGDAG
jgi:hypothetical protein